MDSEALTKLKKLLEQGNDVNAKDANGQTLLHHATSNEEYEVVEHLLKNGANALATSDNGNNTALHVAVAKNDEAMVSVILENVARKKLRKLLDAKSKPKGTAALHLAAECDCHVNTTCDLLEYGANFEIADDAGKKPVDLARREDLRELFQLIDACFAKAKTGDERLTVDLAKCDSATFTSALNCRNNDGHTLVQVLVLNGHYKLVADMLVLRMDQPSDADFLMLADPKRQNEVDKLAKASRDCREFWSEKRRAVMKLTEDIQKCGSVVQFKFVTTHAAKMGCQALEKAHEVLLAYRKFEGKERTLTTNGPMKILQEVFEALGFDPEQLYVVIDDESCYYQKLPSQFKDNIAWLINLLNCIVDASISCLLRCICTVQIFGAAKADDTAKLMDLLERGGSCNGRDEQRRTPLSYAVEKNSEKMVGLLLMSGAAVAYPDAISSLYLAIDTGNAKIVKLLLQYVDVEEMADFIDCRDKFDGTALHHAAKKGDLDIVVTLLRYGAMYWVFDANDCTPFDVATSEEVREFFALVDECFHDAKEADDGLVDKLKEMKTDEFMAVAGTRNFQGHTLAIVAAKAGAKIAAGIILRMIRDAKKNEVLVMSEKNF